MRPSVLNGWPEFIAAYEGRTSWLYFDTHTPPLATTGVGHLVDDGQKLTRFGVTLPWRAAGGAYATEAEAQQEYNRLKALGLKGSGFAYRTHATLFLDAEVVDWMLAERTDEFIDRLEAQLPSHRHWPADAQLALLNMAWHLGPNFLGSGWPNFTKAARVADFLTMAEHGSTSRNTARDARNQRLLVNAARVDFADLDRDKLWDAVTPEHPLGGEARTRVFASAVQAAKGAGEASVDFWYVQRMLNVTGHYKGALDGIRGKLSNDALRTWAKSQGITYASTPQVLGKLSEQSIRMPVV